MTAFLSVRTGDAIHLFADGALIDPHDGNIVHIASKIVAMPPARCSLVARAMVGVIAHAFGDEAARQGVTSFDGLIERFGDIHKATVESGRRFRPTDIDDHEFVIAGWSESRDRPEQYYCGTHGRYPEADGKLHEAGAAVWGGPVVPLDWIDPEDFDAERDGVRAFELMRAEPMEMFDGRMMLAVGGFVECHTITRDKVTARIIHTWPDDVPGAPIKPALVQ